MPERTRLLVTAAGNRAEIFLANIGKFLGQTAAFPVFQYFGENRPRGKPKLRLTKKVKKR
ncbi:hypothetical protein AB434_3886 [Heyndrickxia coagulans]|uniref:Uncharacterized protein n=1 Tax=Heyndrickxia coagulans TaxID=1398 RepID=A0AAN0WBE4_HEYCO|nr:hypothetical protein SB48_HM08orf02165 [Heyndrickxia coagulans]AKN56291.1 hypothetical protein AB434_3886 [Heyndrickxia coagulans]KYC64575.1 hypothetical protein B4100_2657 [Heyndrickxia coagulans]KYC92330.1 hypothetical protein B4096_2563 [Heyndrickxia coagulans]